jgi:hypothetical protein
MSLFEDLDFLCCGKTCKQNRDENLASITFQTTEENYMFRRRFHLTNYTPINEFHLSKRNAV